MIGIDCLASLARYVKNLFCSIPALNALPGWMHQLFAKNLNLDIIPNKSVTVLISIILLPEAVDVLKRYMN